ncbi:MAG: alpha/beta hydrolase [Cytophagales bacterium]|nr:alpha/beta hydrolase [Armatimonadota bacterium]
MAAALTTLCALSPAVVAPRIAAAAPPLPAPDQKADSQMKAVLLELARLNPTPLYKLTPAQVRKRPGPPDAVKAVLVKQGKPTTPEPVAKVENRTVPGPAGAIPVRVYTPSGTGPFPVLVYFHGGGWVIGSVQAYDSSCRALANAASCVVVSVEYRLAPEHKFPASHEDSYAATQYVMKNTAQFGGDPKRVAVGGESAGGNLAASVCLMARNRGGRMPIHQLDVYPIAGYNLNTPSYRANATAIPLSRPFMAWFFRYALRSPRDGRSPMISLDRANLRGLPPATVITAQIDPLQSEGKVFADRLKAVGIPVRYRNYDGVAHEFFGMAAVVDKAKDANAFAADGLKAAFSK